MAHLAFITILLMSFGPNKKLVSCLEKIKCTESDCDGKLACATIFTNSEYKGYSQCHTFTNNDCIDLNEWWSHGRVSSVDIHQTCVRLYANSFCRGQMKEIRQDTKGREHLGKMKFNDMTMSISPCTEDKLYKCRIQVLFSTKIPATEVSTAVTEVLEIVDKIPSYILSTGVVQIPDSNSLYKGLTYVFNLFNEEKVSDTLIHANIKNTNARNSASQISTKMRILHNKLRAALSPETSVENQRIEIELALYKGEEIVRLFQDYNFAFPFNKIVSSPYLVSFSSVYLVLAEIGYQLNPDLKNKTVNDVQKVAKLTEQYLREATDSRKKLFDLGYDDGYVVEDRLVCKTSFFYNRRDPVCSSYMKCPRDRVGSFMEACYLCMQGVQETSEIEMEKFFRRVIIKLNAFSNKQ